MADATNKKKVGEQFSNQATIVEASYDFDNDGGALGDLSLLEADGPCIVHLKHAIVETACTSGGSAVVDLGKSGGAEMLSDVAVASLTADSLHTGSAPVELESGEKVDMGIETAALTAGKIRFVFEVYKK